MAGNTGTKQIRIGRVHRLIREFEAELARLNKDLTTDNLFTKERLYRALLEGEIKGVGRLVDRLKEEFDSGE